MTWDLGLGLMWTKAKGCDHDEIASPRETRPETILLKIKIEFVLSRAFKCSAKGIHDRAFNQMLFITILFLYVHLHNK